MISAITEERKQLLLNALSNVPKGKSSDLLERLQVRLESEENNNFLEESNYRMNRDWSILNHQVIGAEIDV